MGDANSATGWNSGITEPQSSFVRELKKELGMRSEAAARKSDMAKMYQSSSLAVE